MHHQSLGCLVAALDSLITWTELFSGLRFVLSPPVSSLTKSLSQIMIRTSLPIAVLIVTLRSAHRINGFVPIAQFYSINEIALANAGE